MDILQGGDQIALQVVESKESKAKPDWDGIKRVLSAYALPAPNQTSRAEMNRGACVKVCTSA